MDDLLCSIALRICGRELIERRERDTIVGNGHLGRPNGIGCSDDVTLRFRRPAIYDGQSEDSHMAKTVDLIDCPNEVFPMEQKFKALSKLSHCSNSQFNYTPQNDAGLYKTRTAIASSTESSVLRNDNLHSTPECCHFHRILSKDERFFRGGLRHQCHCQSKQSMMQNASVKLPTKCTFDFDWEKSLDCHKRELNSVGVCRFHQRLSEGNNVRSEGINRNSSAGDVPFPPSNLRHGCLTCLQRYQCKDVLTSTLSPPKLDACSSCHGKVHRVAFCRGFPCPCDHERQHQLIPCRHITSGACVEAVQKLPCLAREEEHLPSSQGPSEKIPGGDFKRENVSKTLESKSDATVNRPPESKMASEYVGNTNLGNEDDLGVLYSSQYSLKTGAFTDPLNVMGNHLDANLRSEIRNKEVVGISNFQAKAWEKGERDKNALTGGKYCERLLKARMSGVSSTCSSCSSSCSNSSGGIAGGNNCSAYSSSKSVSSYGGSCKSCFLGNSGPIGVNGSNGLQTTHLSNNGIFDAEVPYMRGNDETVNSCGQFTDIASNDVRVFEVSDQNSKLPVPNTFDITSSSNHNGKKYYCNDDIASTSTKRATRGIEKVMMPLNTIATTTLEGCNDGISGGKRSLLKTALLDCYGRFLLNLPTTMLNDPMHLFFQIQEAHWWYDDFWHDKFPNKLPKMNLRQFGSSLATKCAMLRKYLPAQSYDAMLRDWRQYSKAIPLRGAIVLNQDLTKCLMVQGWYRGEWMFPRGKVDEVESDVVCACREVWEEVGFDITPFIDENATVESFIDGRHTKYFVVYGIDERTAIFAPQKRKEIRQIRWVNLRSLAGWDISVFPEYEDKPRRNLQSKGFFKHDRNVTPIIKGLRKLVDKISRFLAAREDFNQ